MKITGVECDVLVVPVHDTDSCDTSQDNIVVQVRTDVGVSGIGEVESNPWVIKALIEATGSNSLNRGLGELLLGEDPTKPQAIWQRLYTLSLLTGRRGAGICAIGALDMAVWDIYGKAASKPIWQLLGGSQQQNITPYASLLPSGHTLEEYRKSLLAKAAWARDFGFEAAKMEILIRGPFAQHGLQERDEEIIELVAACRETLGPHMTMMVDVGYCWEDWEEALRVIRRLERYDLFFLETPLAPDDLDGYARLADATGIRIAAGELLQTRFEFAELMDRGHVDVVQPDVGRVGGITEAIRVIRMAVDRGKMVVPHCWKSGIGIAATAHVVAAAPNCPYIEFLPAAVSESPLRRELVADELQIENGKLPLPQRPGLGIDLNPVAFARFTATNQKLEAVSSRA